MSHDGRKKGCPNVDCSKHQKQFKFEAEDNYCTECGSKLVFVCAKCFKEIPDEGPHHKYCEKCEAEKQDEMIMETVWYKPKELADESDMPATMARHALDEALPNVKHKDVVEAIIDSIKNKDE